MVDLNLDFDEGVILETDEVHRSANGGRSSYIKNMFLTNKNIIYVTSQKTGGMFSKSVDVVDKVPLSEVKVINGQVLASQKKTDLFEYALQIQFISGIEEYSYSEGSKKITNQWVNELNNLLGSGQPVMTQASAKKNDFLGGLSGLASSVGAMAGSLGQSVSSAAKQATDQAGISYENAKAQMEAKRQVQAQEEAAFHQAFAPQTTPPPISRATGSFCVNCGTKLNPGAKFCPGCGAAVSASASSMNVPPIPTASPANPTTRQQEFAGKIIKCPACGTEIPSFTAICPRCGHEINSTRVSSAIKDFTNQISQCDRAIANSPAEPKKGWKSWSGGKKVGWVFLNLFTFCIPLVIYLILSLLGIGSMSSLTPEEKNKAQLINNFAFPNDREDILEGLLYIKSQTASLASGKIDRNTWRWMKIWKNKASQLFERAEMMFKGDKIANDAYTDILASEKKVKKSLLIRVIIAIVLVALFSAFVFARGAGNSIKEANATFEWPSTGIALQVPEPPTNKGEIKFNDDQYFSLKVRGIDQSQYETYISECKDKGFTIDNEKNSDLYEAYNGEGYHLQLFYYSSSTDLTIDVEAPEPMGEIQWPKSDIAKRLPVPKSSYGSIDWEADYGFKIYLGNTTKQDFLDYADACYDAGFTKDYEKGDTYFRADDSEGYHVNLEYRGNNVMFIGIDEPK